MRHLIYLLTIWIVFSCQSKTPTSDILIDNVEQNEVKLKESDTLRTYITDSNYLNYNYPTGLKSGFRLQYKVYVEPNSTDTMQTIYLMNGDREIKDLNGGSSYGLPHKNIGYIRADFDSSFVFVQSYGSGNPIFMQLIDKKSGKQIRKGTWVDASENEQVLLYIEDEHKESEKLIIYDITKSNEIVSSGFEKSKCVEEVSGGLRNCVKIDTVTTTEIILKTTIINNTLVKRYNR